MSENYCLLSGDLREMATLGDRLLSGGVDTRFAKIHNENIIKKEKFAVMILLASRQSS